MTSCTPLARQGPAGDVWVDLEDNMRVLFSLFRQRRTNKQSRNALNGCYGRG